MDRRSLVGTWIEAQVEPGRVVYRGTHVEFPPSRVPRSAMTLMEDGTLHAGRPGPTDALQRTTGHWECDGDQLTLTTPGRSQRYVIERLDADTLILRPLAPEAPHGEGQG